MKTPPIPVLFAAMLVSCVASKDATRTHDAGQSKQAFEMICSLAGKWRGTTTATDHTGAVDLVYEVVSGGSVVLERLHPGAPTEMISMYHLDGDRLLMTHYCVLGNQPRMELEAFSPAPEPTAAFSFRDATNWKGPGELVMHDVRLSAIDANHLAATWCAWQNGVLNHSSSFTFERVQ